jgi:hypothetical protein
MSVGIAEYMVTDRACARARDGAAMAAAKPRMVLRPISYLLIRSLLFDCDFVTTCFAAQGRARGVQPA